MSIKQIFDELAPKDNGGDGEMSKDGEGGGFDEHDWEAASEMSDEEIKEMHRDIDDAVRQGIAAAKKAGIGTSNSALGLQEFLKPRVNWKAQLREFVRTTCATREQSTWRRPKRRYFNENFVLPTMQGQSLRELVLAVDASGSMLGKPLQVVMSEVQGVAQQMSIEKIHLLYWDGAVERHEEYDKTTFSNWKQNTTPKGGGGTSPACISTYLADKKIKPDAVVVLTDGEVVGWGQWSVPVLWAIYNPSNTIIAPVGKTISIETD
jgi:predicted metal-dependent peptidase